MRPNIKNEAEHVPVMPSNRVEEKRVIDGELEPIRTFDGRGSLPADRFTPPPKEMEAGQP